MHSRSEGWKVHVMHSFQLYFFSPMVWRFTKIGQTIQFSVIRLILRLPGFTRIFFFRTTPKLKRHSASKMKQKLMESISTVKWLSVHPQCVYMYVHVSGWSNQIGCGQPTIVDSSVSLAGPHSSR